MTFAELKKTNPKLYRKMQSKAWELGIIETNRSLESVDNDPKYAWLLGYLNMIIAGKIEQGFGGYRNRFINAHRRDTSPDNAVGTIVAAANRHRKFEANTGEHRASAAANSSLTPEELRKVDQMAQGINRRRYPGAYMGKNNTPAAANNNGLTPEELRLIDVAAQAANKYRR